MTASRLARTGLTLRTRKISKAIFGRPHQLEIAAALDSLATNSTIDEIYMTARARAVAAGFDPPKEGSVRKSIDRLVMAGAVDSFPPSTASRRRGQGAPVISTRTLQALSGSSPLNSIPERSTPYWVFQLKTAREPLPAQARSS